MGRYNTQRLHSHLGDTPPAEFEEAYAARQADHAKPVAHLSLHKTQCDSEVVDRFGGSVGDIEAVSNSSSRALRARPSPRTL